MGIMQKHPYVHVHSTTVLCDIGIAMGGPALYFSFKFMVEDIQKCKENLAQGVKHRKKCFAMP